MISWGLNGISGAFQRVSECLRGVSRGGGGTYQVSVGRLQEGGGVSSSSLAFQWISRGHYKISEDLRDSLGSSRRFQGIYVGFRVVSVGFIEGFFRIVSEDRKRV